MTHWLLPIPRSRTNVLAVTVAALLLLWTRSIAATPLYLTGRYAGTYLEDGTNSAQTLQLEFERQHGRRVRVSVFAMNQPEFMGHGHLSLDNATLKLATHATGRRHLVLQSKVLAGGAILEGTFTAKRRGRPTVTGTFSVSR